MAPVRSSRACFKMSAISSACGDTIDAQKSGLS